MSAYVRSRSGCVLVFERGAAMSSLVRAVSSLTLKRGASRSSDELAEDDGASQKRSRVPAAPAGQPKPSAERLAMLVAEPNELFCEAIRLRSSGLHELG